MTSLPVQTPVQTASSTQGGLRTASHMSFKQSSLNLGQILYSVMLLLWSRAKELIGCSQMRSSVLACHHLRRMRSVRYFVLFNSARLCCPSPCMRVVSRVGRWSMAFRQGLYWPLSSPSSHFLLGLLFPPSPSFRVGRRHRRHAAPPPLCLCPKIHQILFRPVFSLLAFTSRSIRRSSSLTGKMGRGLIWTENRDHCSAIWRHNELLAVSRDPE